MEGLPELVAVEVAGLVRVELFENALKHEVYFTVTVHIISTVHYSTVVVIQI